MNNIYELKPRERRNALLAAYHALVCQRMALWDQIDSLEMSINQMGTEIQNLETDYPEDMKND